MQVQVGTIPAYELGEREVAPTVGLLVLLAGMATMQTGTVEAQQHRASGLALVTAVIALWNTVYLGRALDALRRRGEVIPDALLAHLAPLGWQHISLTGDYLWAVASYLGQTVSGRCALRPSNRPPLPRDRIPGSPHLPCYPARYME